MNKTDWFDGRKFVPAHVGIYERRYASEHCAPLYSTRDYWNGEKWIYELSGRELAPNLDWRGLKEKTE